LGNKIRIDKHSQIKFEIIKKMGMLSKTASGWEKQLNLMRWNERDPKYDIREWSPDGGKMGKGVTLSKEELAALKELLNKVELQAGWRRIRRWITSPRRTNNSVRGPSRQ
jgi:hypothetical protein